MEYESEAMITSLKKVDDRPRVLWKCSLEEPEMIPECRMKNAPLEVFICPQVESCKFQCVQKTEQQNRPDYVREQQLKMLVKIELISQNNGNNGRGKTDADD